MTFTVISELMVQDHPAVGQRGAAVAEGHLDAVVDFSARHISGDGKHVDSRYMNSVLFSVGRRSEVFKEVCIDKMSTLHHLASTILPKCLFFKS